jgi:hypothetical protein
VALAAGEKVPEPSSLHNNTIDSGVHDDPELKSKDLDAFGVAPLPATAGIGNPIALAAGEKVPEPSSFHNNTIDSGVHDDPELKSKDLNAFGVAPIPATAGIGNPVHLEPGEAVPHHSTLTSNTVDSSVKLDKASYEKSDSGAPQLPPVLTPGSEQEAFGAKSVFGLGPAVGGTFIPESSLPMGEKAVSDVGPMVSSVAPQSTTNELAGQQPILARGVPEVVAESHEQAHVSPEAAANPEAVQDKSELENELKQKVSPEAAISSVAPQSTTNELAGQQPTLPRGVPDVVAESQEQAHVSPEAAANPEAVQDKTELENELKQKVTEEPAAAESSGVPQVVEESQEKADVSPEAAANPEAVEEKAQVEDELKQKVPEQPATASSGIFGNSERGITGAIAGGALAAGGAAAAGAFALRQKATETTGKDPVAALPKSVQDALPESIVGGNTTSADTNTSDLPKPATAPSETPSNNERGITGAIAGGAATAGGAVAAGAFALRQKATETTGKDPVAALPKSVQDTLPGSVVGGATTSANTDAAGLPLAPATVPHVVEESQERAHVEPEAAANPEAVVEKADVEEELKQKVPEAPATAESGLLGKSEAGLLGNSGSGLLGSSGPGLLSGIDSNKGVAGAVAGGAVAVGAAAAGGAYALNQKVHETTGTDAMSKLPKSVQDSINNMNSKGTTAPETTSTAPSTAIPNAAISQDPSLPQQTAIGEGVTVPSEVNAPKAASGVPEEVIHSQQEAHVSPEAAANPEAVLEKKAMEQELQSSVKPVEASGEPAPTVTAATSAIAPIAASSTSASGAPQISNAAPVSPVSPISMENTTPSTGANAIPIGKEVAPVNPAISIPGIPTGLAETTNLEPTTSAGAINLPNGKEVAPTNPDNVNVVGVPAGLANTTSSLPTTAATGSKELNASADTPARTAVQQSLAAPEQAKPLDSRDVSPMSRVATKNHPDGSESGPVVTDGVTSTTVPTETKPAAPATPTKPVGSRPEASNNTPSKRASVLDRVKNTPESTKTSGAASGSESQKKRRSFFGRIKDKLTK